jgi:hypothetical protein
MNEATLLAGSMKFRNSKLETSAAEWLSYTAITAFVSVIFCVIFKFGFGWLRFHFTFADISSAADSLTTGFLGLHSAFARHSAFGGSLSSILLRMNTQLVP